VGWPAEVGGIPPTRSADGTPETLKRWNAAPAALLRDRILQRGIVRMPRYYFDLVDDIKIRDQKGVSLPNIDAAREYAKTFARELMEEKPTLMGESHNAWSVHVSNGRFERVLKIPFVSLMERAPKIPGIPDEDAVEG